MGIYDPEFHRKTFVAHWRDGEIPGSLVLGKGKSTNKGCIWQGQGGRWYAAVPPYDNSKAFYSFETKDEAMLFIVEPHRIDHENRENYREHQWLDAEPKRTKRREDTAAKEKGKLERFETAPHLKLQGQHVFRILNAEGVEVGRVVRKTISEARVGAASLLGMKLLPEGWNAEQVVQ